MNRVGEQFPAPGARHGRRAGRRSPAGVAQRQSGGFVNRWLGVQFLSPAFRRPGRRVKASPGPRSSMGRFPSGQRGRAVNSLRKLRRFESSPAHFPFASLAQWQRTILVRWGSWVRIPWEALIWWVRRRTQAVRAPPARGPVSDGEEGRPDHHRDGVYGLQRAELHDLQEQAERPAAAGTEEVLPPLPAPHDAPGDEVGCRVQEGVIAEHWLRSALHPNTGV